MPTATPMATTSTTAHSTNQRLRRRARCLAGGPAPATGGRPEGPFGGGRGPEASDSATTGPDGAPTVQGLTALASRSHKESSGLDGSGRSQVTKLRGYR